MVWGWFGKSAISLSLFMGFQRAIYQMKAYFMSYYAKKHGCEIILFPEVINDNSMLSLLFF